MAFADVVDVATRLGRSLSTIEASRAEQMLDEAASYIAAAADQDDEWAAALDPVPGAFRWLSVAMVVRSWDNPGGARSVSEQLGAWQHSQSFRDEASGGGMSLTPVEESLVRRIVWGTTTGSARTDSVACDLPRRCL